VAAAAAVKAMAARVFGCRFWVCLGDYSEKNRGGYILYVRVSGLSVTSDSRISDGPETYIHTASSFP
jgi:hypothetical protein